MKEFLSRNNVAFRHVDILRDPEAMDMLRELGVRNVPVVTRGREFVFGQKLDDVARFVGLQAVEHRPLTSEELYLKWQTVLRAVHRYVGQFTAAQLREPAVEGRPRTVRVLGHHIFRIAEVFLETAVDGKTFQSMQLDTEPASGAFETPEEIRRYGASMISSLERWWERLPDRSCTHAIETFYGTQPVHLLLERSTWHSAQHARQLIAVLERLHMAPDGPLRAEDYDGLPMPEGL